MNIVLLITIILHAASIGFLGLCTIRIFSYLRRHKFQENNYTLLFGFIGIQHVTMAYLIIVAAFTVGSTILVLSLIKP
jgi:uncharacterized protein (DUF2235 family)